MEGSSFTFKGHNLVRNESRPFLFQSLLAVTFCSDEPLDKHFGGFNYMSLELRHVDCLQEAEGLS